MTPEQEGPIRPGISETSESYDRKYGSDSVPKEGPPTRRELRDILQKSEWCEGEMECPCCGVFKPILERESHEDDCLLRNALDRLTDEALGRDEKRTAALEALEKRVRYLADIIPGMDGEDLNEWTRTFANSVKEKLDALTPAPQNKETPT